MLARSQAGGEARIGLADLAADGPADQGERIGVRGRCLLHALPPIEGEARIVEHFLYRMARMHAAQAEAMPRPVIVEERQIGEERVGAARPVDAIRAGPRCADEVDLVDEHPPRMLLAEED